jgi:hypothetical protein
MINGDGDDLVGEQGGVLYVERLDQAGALRVGEKYAGVTGAEPFPVGSVNSIAVMVSVERSAWYWLSP